MSAGFEPIDVEAWAALLDKFVFNLRSALNDLVYELNVLRYDGSVPPDVETVCEFPIFTEPTTSSMIRRSPTSMIRIGH